MTVPSGPHDIIALHIGCKVARNVANDALSHAMSIDRRHVAKQASVRGIELSDKALVCCWQRTQSDDVTEAATRLSG